MEERKEKEGIAGSVWAAMAIIGCIVGCLFSTTTLIVITSICLLFFGSVALLLSMEYGLGAVLGVAWWAGMFLVPMWLGALIRLIL